jgi:hypothetical protein
MRARLEEHLAGARSPLRFELVFGHAWGTGPGLPPGEFRLDVSRIGRRARR